MDIREPKDPRFVILKYGGNIVEIWPSGRNINNDIN